MYHIVTVNSKCKISSEVEMQENNISETVREKTRNLNVIGKVFDLARIQRLLSMYININKYDIIIRVIIICSYILLHVGWLSLLVQYRRP